MSLAVAPAMGCEPETDIRGELVLERMAPVDFPGVATAVGVLDDWVLITSIEYQAPQPEPWGEVVYETFVTWVDPEDHVGEPISLGRSNQPLVDRPRWVAWDGALWGSVMATQAEVPPTQRHFVRIVGIRPDGISCMLEPELDFVEDDFVGTAGFGTALGGSHPAVLTPTGPLFTISGSPRHCGTVSYRRPLGIAVEECNATTSWLTPADCSTDALRESLSNWPVADRDRIGILSSRSIGAVTWTVVGEGTSPRIVGDPRRAFERRVPTAFADESHVLLLEASELDARCTFVRGMRWDGTDAGDARWQLPCAATRRSTLGRDEHVRTGLGVDLVRLGSVALVAALDGPTELDDRPAEALLVALTSRGQRASPAVGFRSGAVVVGTHEERLAVVALESDWVLRRYRWEERTP